MQRRSGLWESGGKIPSEVVGKGCGGAKAGCRMRGGEDLRVVEQTDFGGAMWWV